MPTSWRRRFSAAEWLALVGAALLIGAGAVCVAAAAGWHLQAWSSQRAWLSSADAAWAQRVLTAPTPVWLPDPHPDATEIVPLTASTGPTAGVTPAPNPADVDLLDASFVFLDPPEAGARAHFSVSLKIRGEHALPLALQLSVDWLDGYRLVSTTPPSQPDAQPPDGMRRLIFDPQPPGDVDLVLEVVAKTDSVEPPVAQIALATGEPLGTAHPRTMAPRPKPGPISAVRIPSLNLNVAVVPTVWEPPAFVVGELRRSANVGQGNAILVGHLGGAAGAVFADLHQLKPGDAIVATSRGLDYPFVVSELQTRPSDDSQPTNADARPKLTLMTCIGTWDPLARNYSDRLWVTAEPAAQAAATIAANAARPPTPAPVPATPAAARPPETAALVSEGIGAERATLDRRWGPPLGETPGKLVVYRQSGAEYHVAFSVDPPRALLVSVQPLARGATLGLSAAVQDARAEFPADAEPRTPAPEGSDSLVVERLASPALGAVVGAGARGGDPGDFVAAYERDHSGGITRVVVAAGDDVEAIMRDASR